MGNRIAGGIRQITGRIREQHLFSFAATSAYFLLLSFIPFILVLLVGVRYTSLSETDMMNTLIRVVPRGVERFISLIVKEVYTKSIAIVPISIVIALWSAAKGFHALSYGLNVIYGVQETRGWFYTRFRSMLYTLVFVLAIMAALFLMVFSKGYSAQALSQLSFLSRFVLSNRYILTCIMLTILFVFMYRFLPNKKSGVSVHIPGALMVGVAWTGFSWFLSIFYSDTVMNMYGSLTAIIIAMVWLYFCMYFFLVGAELNVLLSGSPEDNILLALLRDIYFSYYLGKEKKRVVKETGTRRKAAI